jgi:hypothetical protein
MVLFLWRSTPAHPWPRAIDRTRCSARGAVYGRLDSFGWPSLTQDYRPCGPVSSGHNHLVLDFGLPLAASLSLASLRR